jgi:hypothetical protein
VNSAAMIFLNRSYVLEVHVQHILIVFLNNAVIFFFVIMEYMDLLVMDILVFRIQLVRVIIVNFKVIILLVNVLERIIPLTVNRKNVWVIDASILHNVNREIMKIIHAKQSHTSHLIDVLP